MNFILDFLKGLALGVVNVIPGFSGGTMAVILKIYERIVNAIADFIKHPLKVIKEMWALIIGVICGIIIGVLVIYKLLLLYPFFVMIFFIGIIVGSIPNILNFIDIKNFKTSNIILAVLGVIMMIASIMIKENKIVAIENAISNNNIGIYFAIFFVAIACAIIMIIPGVSGSFMLMISGFYPFVILQLTNCLLIIKTGNFSAYASSFLTMLIFAIGVLIGLILISKLIVKLFKHNSQNIYAFIGGIIVTAPFVMVYKLFSIENYQINLSSLQTIDWIVGFALLIVGIVLSFIFTKEKKQIANK